MIQDDQVAESGKSARKRDRLRRGSATAVAPSARAISIPLLTMPPIARPAAEPADDGARDRPVEVAAERPQRQRGGSAAAAPVASSRSVTCSFCWAACSSPASCAFRSRRRSMSRIEVVPRLRRALRRRPRALAAAVARAPRAAARAASSVARVVFSSASVCWCDATRSRSSLASAATVRDACPMRRRSASRGAAADSAPGRACRSRRAARCSSGRSRRVPTSAARPSARWCRQLGLDLRGVAIELLQLLRS